VFGYERAWGIIEIPALEVAPHSRRLEVYGTGGAMTIPHLGSGHLANKDIQPVDVYTAGAAEWRRLNLTARTIADRRPARVRRLRGRARSSPIQPRTRPGGAGNAAARLRDVHGKVDRPCPLDRLLPVQGSRVDASSIPGPEEG